MEEVGLLGPAGIGKGCRPAAWTLGREAGIAYLHVVHLGRRLGWWIFMLDAAATGSVGRNGQHLAMGERSAGLRGRGKRCVLRSSAWTGARLGSASVTLDRTH